MLHHPDELAAAIADHEAAERLHRDAPRWLAAARSRRLGGAGMRRGLRGSGGGGGGGGAPWSPSDRGADLVAWYRETYSAGTWTDDGPNSDDLTQATASARPTATTRDGQPVLSFDGGDYTQGLFTSTLSQPWTVYAVAERTDATTNRRIFDNGSGGVGASIYSDSNWRFNAGTLITGSSSDTSPHAFCGIGNTTSSALYVDNATTANASGNAGSSDLIGLTAGALRNGNFPWLGYIWEIVVISGSDTPGERSQMFEYFAGRYPSLSLTY